MMYLIKNILPIILLAFITNNLSAAKIDIKAKICKEGNEFVYVDVYVKKKGKAPVNLADQNYRFSYNPDAVQNPSIVTEGDISGFFSNNGSWGYYLPHTTTGSIPSITSYNVVLSGNTGYPLSVSTWSHVGQLRFEIVDPLESLNFVWHDMDTFPPTYASEVTNAGLEELDTNFEVEYCPDFCEVSYEILCVNETINGVNYVYDFQVTTTNPNDITIEGYPLQFFINLSNDAVWRDLGNDVYAFYMAGIALNNIQLTNCLGEEIKVEWPTCPSWGEGKEELSSNSQKRESNLFNLDVNSPAIYPNPASEYLILESRIDAEIEIYSIQGQLVKQVSLKANTKEQLDISMLQNGVYFVKDLTSNHIEKLVIN